MSDGETDEERQAWAEYWQDGACPMDEQHAFIEGFRAARSAPPPAPPVGGGEAERLAKYESALRLIACGERADGTYNRSREACRALAEEALSPETPAPVEAASPPPEGRSGGAEILYTGDVGPLDCAVYDEEGRRVPPDLTFPAEPSVREWRVVGLGLKGLAPAQPSGSPTKAHDLATLRVELKLLSERLPFDGYLVISRAVQALDALERIASDYYAADERAAHNVCWCDPCQALRALSAPAGEGQKDG